MTDENKQLDHRVWKVNDTVISVDFVKSGEGYASDWWVSSNFDGLLQVVGNYNIPIYGYDLAEVNRRAEIMLHDIMMFAVKTYGGEGDVSATLKPSAKERIAGVHLWQHRGFGPSMGLLERTAEQYKLCAQFKVRDVAQVIACVEDAKVRAIHERIQRCRKAGLLPAK